MHHSYLCDSAKKLMNASPGSQVIGENVFGKPVCKVFLIFDMLKTIWKPMYIMISNTWLISSQFYFKIETTQMIFSANLLITT